MGFFDKIRNGLTKTRAQLQTQLEWMVKGKSLDEAPLTGSKKRSYWPTGASKRPRSWSRL